MHRGSYFHILVGSKCPYKDIVNSCGNIWQGPHTHSSCYLSSRLRVVVWLWWCLEKLQGCLLLFFLTERGYFVVVQQLQLLPHISRIQGLILRSCECLCGVSVYVLPVSVWVSSTFSGFPHLPKTVGGLTKINCC